MPNATPASTTQLMKKGAVPVFPVRGLRALFWADHTRNGLTKKNGRVDTQPDDKKIEEPVKPIPPALDVPVDKASTVQREVGRYLPGAKGPGILVQRQPKGLWRIENNKTVNGLWLRVDHITLTGSCQFRLGEQRFLFRAL